MTLVGLLDCAMEAARSKVGMTGNVRRDLKEES